jgi:hypothetical protein
MFLIEFNIGNWGMGKLFLEGKTFSGQRTISQMA